ncbi:hypothetical protein F0562_020857 [Nyssa sinensis]|uniref:Cysteine-rich transmembrane domain-containing protein n=1 Tax=Nyssa sinensis TaxID=561372 RepID=A0A5J5BVT2_9ASTE|nr:hypothetical protein F0562_020857 [Nyssa sinensis]
MPPTVSGPTGYWPEKQYVGGGFTATTLGAEQPVYMIPASAGVYHAPMGRQAPGPTSQGYYAVQRMPPEVYRDQQMYNVVPPVATAPTPAAAPPTLTPQPPQKVATAYSEGIGMVWPPPPTGGMGVADTGYAHVAYDSGMGRQLYYTAPGGVAPPQYQAMAATAVSADMRSVGALNQEGKVVAKKMKNPSYAAYAYPPPAQAPGFYQAPPAMAPPVPPYGSMAPPPPYGSMAPPTPYGSMAPPPPYGSMAPPPYGSMAPPPPYGSMAPPPYRPPPSKKPGFIKGCLSALRCCCCMGQNGCDPAPGFYQGPPVMAPLVPTYGFPPPPSKKPGFIKGCLSALRCCCCMDQNGCDPDACDLSFLGDISCSLG